MSRFYEWRPLWSTCNGYSTVFVGWVFIAPRDTLCAVAFLSLQNLLSSLDLPAPPPQNTVQFEYLYISALWPHGQKGFSACLCPFFFSHPSWKIMKSFLIQLLFTGGCLEHASFSYQRLTRPNRCSPPLLPLPLSLPLPQHLLNYLSWRDLSSFRWSGWAISLDILHGHK